MNCCMSRKGNCYENACIESFHGVLKKELIYQQQYATRAQTQQDIWVYIEIFYNRKRIHSANGYLSSTERNVCTNSRDITEFICVYFINLISS
ncbi:IS3 family transposase [Bacillus thuringiensis]